MQDQKAGDISTEAAGAESVEAKKHNEKIKVR